MTVHEERTQERTFPGLTDSGKYSDERIAAVKLALTLTTCITAQLGGECKNQLSEEQALFFAHPKKTDAFIIGCKKHIESAAAMVNGFTVTVRYALNLLTQEEARRTTIKMEDAKRREAEEQKLAAKRAELRKRIALGVAILEDKRIDEVTPQEIEGWMASHPTQLSTLKMEIDKEWAQRERASEPRPTAPTKNHKQFASTGNMQNRMTIPTKPAAGQTTAN